MVLTARHSLGGFLFGLVLGRIGMRRSHMNLDALTDRPTVANFLIGSAWISNVKG